MEDELSGPLDMKRRAAVSIYPPSCVVESDGGGTRRSPFSLLSRPSLLDRVSFKIGGSEPAGDLFL